MRTAKTDQTESLLGARHCVGFVVLWLVCVPAPFVSEGDQKFLSRW